MTTFPQEKQPNGLYVLFATELWERFGFYTIQAILVLYMTQVFRFDDNHAYLLFGTFTALLYITPVFGGYLADRFIGYRYAVILGGILLALGYFLMAIPGQHIFYYALAIQICGNGFFKSSVSSIVGQLYERNDPRRDGGFTIFYVGINVGAFIGPLIVGVTIVKFGWASGGILAGIGMLFGVLTFILGLPRLSGKGLMPKPESNSFWYSILGRQVLVYSALAGMFTLMLALLDFKEFSNSLLVVFGLVILVFVLFRSARYPKQQRNRLYVCIILTLFSIVYFVLYQQPALSITLFTERDVDRQLLGFDIPTVMFQSLNPFFIIVIGPLLSRLWLKLARKNKNPSIPMKFALGIIQTGLGFVVLDLAQKFAGSSSLVNVWWLVLSYMLQTTGELFVSPVGLSMIAAFAPAEILALMMGAWFLASAIANAISGYAATFTSIPENITDPAVIGSIYGHVFYQYGMWAIAFGLAMIALTPRLKRMLL